MPNKPLSRAAQMHTMSRLTKHILYVWGIACVLLIFHFSGIGCPIRAALGFPCPTCGMTRAVFALARLDIEASLSYNPAALIMPAAVLLGLHKDLFSNKRRVDTILILIAVASFLLYLYRIIFISL